MKKTIKGIDAPQIPALDLPPDYNDDCNISDSCVSDNKLLPILMAVMMMLSMKKFFNLYRQSTNIVILVLDTVEFVMSLTQM